MRRLLPGLLLLAIETGSVAHAASLVEVTGGVLGRAEVEGQGPAERRARTLVDREEWAAAAVAWADARRQGADPTVAAAWETVSLARAEQWQVARLSALSALARDPTSPQAHLGFAWLMAELGAGRVARKVLGGLSVEDPGARVLTLRSARIQGGARRAARARRAALRAGSLDAWMWLEAGLAALQRGDPEAIGDLERAVRSDGATAVHTVALVEVRRMLGEHAVAMRLAVEGMARWPDSQDLASAGARVATEPEGRQALERWLASRPGDGAALELGGVVALAEGDADVGQARLRAALEAGRRSVGVYGLLGAALAGTEAHTEAAEVLAQGLAEHPGHVGLLADRLDNALAAGFEGEVLATAEAWRRSQAQVGAEVPPPVSLAAIDAAEALGRSSEALSWAELVLALQPAQPRALRARAEALGQLGRGRQALSAFEEALRVRPEDATLMASFADFLLAPGDGVPPDPERAWRLAEAALAVEGAPDPALHDLLARAAWARGERGRAIEHQQRAVELAPEDPGLLQRLRQYREGRP